MGLKFQNAAPPSFHSMTAKLYEDIGCHSGIQAVTFVNWPHFKILWHFIKF